MLLTWNDRTCKTEKKSDEDFEENRKMASETELFREVENKEEKDQQEEEEEEDACLSNEIRYRILLSILTLKWLHIWYKRK